MTTSNTNDPSLPTPPVDPVWSCSHWDAMIATLEPSQTEKLAVWIDNDLADLEIRLADFGSPRSRAASATGRR